MNKHRLILSGSVILLLVSLPGCLKQKHQPASTTNTGTTSPGVTIQSQMDPDEMPLNKKSLTMGQQVAMLHKASVGPVTSFTQLGNELSKKIGATQFDRTLSSERASTEKAFAQTGGSCASLEFPGMGPGRNDLAGEEMKLAKTYFESSKHSLQKWISENKSLSKEQASWMKERVRKLVMMTKPMDEEPDLSWRGIGVLTYDPRGNGVVQLGGGFAQLLRKDPERAKFEITRLAAQTWAPCQFQTTNHPWSGFLTCMKINETMGCGSHEYSESGWAISSALAYQLSKPNCELPAFTDQGNMACATNMVAHNKK
jgi:hypothetical protein